MKSNERYVAEASNIYNYTSSDVAKSGLLCLCLTGDFVYEPGYDLTRVNFGNYLLAVILSGQITFEAEGRVYDGKADDVVLIDCNKQHRYYSTDGARIVFAHFNGAPAKAYYNWIIEKNGNVFATRNIRRIVKCLNEIYEMFHEQRVANEAQIALYLTSALTAMTESAAPSKHIRNNEDAIDEVLAYINGHLNQELTIQELARRASFSEYHFIRVFRDAVGMTPRSYIIAARMDYAKYLLKTTTMAVQEIGWQVGYASEGMFCNTFKRITGQTPSEYRTDVMVIAE